MPKPEPAAPVSAVDISTDAFAHDAIRGYEQIRKEGPVVWQAPSRGYLLTGYEATAAALRSKDVRAADLSEAWFALQDKLHKSYDGALRLFSFMPFVMEGTRHLQIRRAMALAVAPFAGGDPCYAAQIERRMANLRDRDRFDLATEFASHLLFDIMCDLLEIPEENRGELKPLATMSWVFEATTTARERDVASQRISVCIDFLTRHVAGVIERGNDGFIATTYKALPEDEPDNVGAVATMVCVMLVMGNNPLATCIVGGVHKLLTQPQALSPADWARASDDAIRFVAPVDFLNRFAEKNVALGGCPIKAHERIIISPMSANHDPAEFGETAGSITVREEPNVGLTFGAGGHICVGNRMSRTIIRMAFAALSELPGLRLAGDPVYGRGKVVRTYASLPLQIDRGS